MEKLKSQHETVLHKFQLQKQAIRRLWNVGKETAELLAFLVHITEPKIVLELGTSNGFSAFHLALRKETKVISIDVETARQDLAKMNLKDFANIEFITQRIENYIPVIDYEIDMLFIDANKTNYLKYLQQLEVYLKDKAIVVADNIDSHSETIKTYRDYVLNSDKYTTIHLSLEAGLLISSYKKNKDVNMKKDTIVIKNETKGRVNSLLNPIEKSPKESKLEEILKEIENIENEED
jgi:predicted O-methyltransferase YrrM